MSILTTVSRDNLFDLPVTLYLTIDIVSMYNVCVYRDIEFMTQLQQFQMMVVISFLPFQLE